MSARESEGATFLSEEEEAEGDEEEGEQRPRGGGRFANFL